MNTTATPLYLQMFPSFPIMPEMSQLPDGFTDSSWCGNSCPCVELVDEVSNAFHPVMTIWMEHPVPEEREGGAELPRFSVVFGDPCTEPDPKDPILHTDEWTEVLTFVAKHRPQA